MPDVPEKPMVEVRRLVGPAELDRALALRVTVFCGEQGVTPEAELDGLDDRALQLGAFAGDEVVGTCRMLEVDGELRVQRVVVRIDCRRHGVGRALMQAALAAALAAGARRVGLHAQVVSQAFYASLGFVRDGPTFLEEGIPHVTMRRELLS
ncbi:MAG: GNAT family N-acetyltransferase [Actinobacteria bacterium]|nr:GNAT family N-acetyltransferase [Actinomycetota bacterium]